MSALGIVKIACPVCGQEFPVAMHPANVKDARHGFVTFVLTPDSDELEAHVKAHTEVSS